MSKTITEIQTEINDTLLLSFPTLSTSTVAQWRLLTYAVAVAMHYILLMYDSLTEELDEIADSSAAGTSDWYVKKILEFQDGHELLYNEETSELYYEQDDEDARIIKRAVVSDSNGVVAIKVAKQSDDGSLEPLGSSEYVNFTSYMNAIKFVGIPYTIVSNNADEVYYKAIIYYDTRYMISELEELIKAADEELRTSSHAAAIPHAQQECYSTTI